MNLREQTNRWYNHLHYESEANGEQAAIACMRHLCRTDLFYLLTRACGRADVDRDWLFHRCLEVQKDPDGMLDLWAREHYKSTIITFGKTIQDILNDQNISIGIFSHTTPIAKSFLRQIKTELETNERLKYLFPDILWANPKQESPLWSEDKGIKVKRTTNPKDATVEASGLVDGQPTGKHFDLLIYDDVVTRESVTTPEQIVKVREAWALSLNLGAEGGRMRVIGTRYHYNDCYAFMMKQGLVKSRIHAATDDGTPTGKPVFLSQESLETKRKAGSYIFACQQLQNPKADDALGFKKEDVMFYDRSIDIEGMNTYILCDPANEKKKKSDYTVFWVLALGPDQNYYAIEIIRDRLNLNERTNTLMRLHREYMPKGVAYEQYGMQSDIQHIEYVQNEQNYRFHITPVAGQMSKIDRIMQLVPVVEDHRLWLPRNHYRRNYEGRNENLTVVFIEDELESFPVMVHDDMLDGLARILDPDLGAAFPEPKEKRQHQSWRDRIARLSMNGQISAQAA